MDLQSEKYFTHCKDEIIDILKIKPDFIEIADDLLPKIDKELVVCILIINYKTRFFLFIPSLSIIQIFFIPSQ